MKSLFRKVRKIVSWGLLILVIFYILRLIGNIFETHPGWFFLPLVIAPVLAAAFKNNKSANKTPLRLVGIFRTILMAIVVVSSFLIFSFPDYISNKVGHNLIHWAPHFNHWVFEWVVFILCIGSPIITWKQCSIVYDEIFNQNPSKYIKFALIVLRELIKPAFTLINSSVLSAELS